MPDSAELSMLSVPPTATLLVDGKPHGRTPAKIALVVGRHAVQIQSGDNVADFVIDVLPSCVTPDNPSRYPEAITAHGYLEERLREIKLK